MLNKFFRLVFIILTEYFEANCTSMPINFVLVRKFRLLPSFTNQISLVVYLVDLRLKNVVFILTYDTN